MSDIQKIKIGEQEYTLKDGSAVAFNEAQALTEEQKQQARANIGAATVGEAGGSSTLIVTIENDVASHTSAEIYAHVQADGTAVLDYNGFTYVLAGCAADYASFDHSYDDDLLDNFLIYDNGSVEYREYTKVRAAVFSEYIPAPTAQVGQTIVVKSVDAKGRPVEWEAADLPSDTHINSLIDAKLGTTFTEIDTLLGGES